MTNSDGELLGDQLTYTKGRFCISGGVPVIVLYTKDDTLRQVLSSYGFYYWADGSRIRAAAGDIAVIEFETTGNDELTANYIQWLNQVFTHD